MDGKRGKRCVPKSIMGIIICNCSIFIYAIVCFGRHRWMKFKCLQSVHIFRPGAYLHCVNRRQLTRQSVITTPSPRISPNAEVGVGFIAGKRREPLSADPHNAR